MKTNELLDCSVFLYSDWWNDNVPKYSVYFDDTLIESGEMSKQLLKEVKFQILSDFGGHRIRVAYENRLPSDNLYANGKSVRSNYIQISNIRLNHFYLNKHLLNKEGIVLSDVKQNKENISVLDTKCEYNLNFESPFAYFFLPKI